MNINTKFITAISDTQTLSQRYYLKFYYNYSKINSMNQNLFNDAENLIVEVEDFKFLRIAFERIFTKRSFALKLYFQT